MYVTSKQANSFSVALLPLSCMFTVFLIPVYPLKVIIIAKHCIMYVASGITDPSGTMENCNKTLPVLFTFVNLYTVKPYLEHSKM